MLQTLTDLLNSAEGVRFLESQGVFASQAAFKERLRGPVKAGLAKTLGAGPDQKLVCSGQQLYVDYRHSVLSKILVLADLQPDPALRPFFLWLDTDRTGSDNLITKFAWPDGGKRGPITIMPPGTREVELRFTALDPGQLASAIDRLETYLRQSGEQRKDARARYQQLRALFTGAPPASLSQFNLGLTNFLLAHVLGFVPQSALLSGLLAQDFIQAEVELLLNHRQAMVQVFNEAIDFLTAQGIDPQVTPLAPDYLPLFYACERDGRRLRLHHHVEGGKQFAVSRCKCGQVYQFHLGRDRLSLGELARTGRWSPDVCFPLLLNDQVSGFVAGKSSAIYLMVLNQVLRRVLYKTPAPILVPADLSAPANGPDSLIYRYFAQG